MRVDKYLKVARILKRRTIGKELADNQRILVNDKPAKPAKDIQVGDTITVLYGQRYLTVKVLALANQTKKNEASDLYQVLAEGYRNSDE